MLRQVTRKRFVCEPVLTTISSLENFQQFSDPQLQPKNQITPQLLFYQGQQSINNFNQINNPFQQPNQIRQFSLQHSFQQWLSRRQRQQAALQEQQQEQIVAQEPQGSLVDPSELVQIAEGAEAVSRAQALEGNWFITRSMENSLCYAHDFFGAPWWVVIVGATTAVRLSTLPLFIMQISNQYKMLKAKPDLNVLLEDYKDKVKRGEADSDWYNSNMQAVFRKHGISPYRNFAPAFINAPIFISFFFTLRTLGESYLPSLSNEGMLWFKDLTAPDPYLGLPIMSSLTLLLLIDYGSPDGGAALKAGGFSGMKWFIRGFSLLTLLAVWDMPAVVPLYWVATNVFQLTVATLLRSNRVRRMFGILDLDAVRDLNKSMQTGQKPESPTAMMAKMYEMMYTKPKEIEKEAQQQKVKYSPNQLLDYNPKAKQRRRQRRSLQMS
eukprot:TRINITY_DN11887_c0_g1_i1.p2 TRINITY_DN11887_c0_g1~~TRINITY_DN11887_c0_g1_i1.p2  ORF type:complete len:438 (+),score=50.27 TRINITY_DN11887_c0_g1_i1:82-1395(+)